MTKDNTAQNNHDADSRREKRGKDRYEKGKVTHFNRCLSSSRTMMESRPIRYRYF